MKQPREKTKIVTETSNIHRLLCERPVLIAEKEGVNEKEPYKPPKMVTKTIDEGTELVKSNQLRSYFLRFTTCD